MNVNNSRARPKRGLQLTAEQIQGRIIDCDESCMQKGGCFAMAIFKASTALQESELDQNKFGTAEGNHWS
ncbi:hypothetical protein GUITHDRAFT_111535 [Guillardia theta CCMP2712]|uniref:Uncharacterized protein n=1 Tax=Guillardia theta (strain CCMP2712) TaxID=905079 RepID=L1J387_GUITC|nr:hypothetical protein GUITHDRAFT_111535 [Guillardia theta CCMP2712]EKX42560.1 hypothetical protein GUITHDRAFT_111535 [Guillardia theta CCMP2712]|eukprot:XP_005829540.1 hypothetical protein GUITHDRAFT_111535 [Guillardia theta CCMP2712]